MLTGSKLLSIIRNLLLSNGVLPQIVQVLLEGNLIESWLIEAKPQAHHLIVKVLTWLNESNVDVRLLITIITTVLNVIIFLYLIINLHFFLLLLSRRIFKLIECVIVNFDNVCNENACNWVIDSSSLLNKINAVGCLRK